MNNERELIRQALLWAISELTSLTSENFLIKDSKGIIKKEKQLRLGGAHGIMHRTQNVLNLLSPMIEIGRDLLPEKKEMLDLIERAVKIQQEQNKRIKVNKYTDLKEIISEL